MALASAFDLLVSAEYYGFVADEGWLACSSRHPIVMYPYTNICPQCIADGRFVYHRANKPKSGVIGATTSKLLAGLLYGFIKHKHPDIQMFRGKEPIDILFVDETTSPITVLFGEIKASPLITFPLCAFPAYEIDQIHHPYPMKVIQTELFLLLPQKTYSLGKVQNTEWALIGMYRLLEAGVFL